MKICWDNLERVSLNKHNNLVIRGDIYIEMEACKVCGDSYLTGKYKQSKFCGYSCAGKCRPHSIETKKKMSITQTGKVLSTEHKKKLAENASKRIGCLNPHYKDGVTKTGLAIYDTYKTTLGLYEDIRKQVDTKILETRCAYCGQWFAPTRTSVKHRLVAVDSFGNGECRLYCSNNCKESCPTYKQLKYPKGFRKATSREVSTYLRQMVFERDGWVCQKCGNTIEDAALHCHHMDPVAQNPMFQNDMDSCVTLCKECHKFVHKQKGCRYVDLRCK